MTHLTLNVLAVSCCPCFSCFFSPVLDNRVAFYSILFYYTGVHLWEQWRSKAESVTHGHKTGRHRPWPRLFVGGRWTGGLPPAALPRVEAAADCVRCHLCLFLYLPAHPRCHLCKSCEWTRHLLPDPHFLGQQGETLFLFLRRLFLRLQWVFPPRDARISFLPRCSQLCRSSCWLCVTCQVPLLASSSSTEEPNTGQSSIHGYDVSNHWSGLSFTFAHSRRFPNWLDRWMVSRKQIGVLALGFAFIHAIYSLVIPIRYSTEQGAIKNAVAAVRPCGTWMYLVSKKGSNNVHTVSICACARLKTTWLSQSLTIQRPGPQMLY